ncbi:hypothetical protein TNIN_23291 [Trichonephila inaurata madagascariensis]|uniref:Uncharacterized protein n=1 Tax=Trichonephila inaurata madagascariensis TaxID=2747483 RepID=A0A8X6YEE0_9ARAC|nr:hypothetical protein TNIN_23291 [Trichonephila inaurata madagascariensis]
MALNLDLKNDNGMDLSLPSSNNTSQSGTPQETNCKRLQALATDVKKFAIIIENFKSTINALRQTPNSKFPQCIRVQPRETHLIATISGIAFSTRIPLPPEPTPGPIQQDDCVIPAILNQSASGQ